MSADTIAARATAPGPGAVAIVRVSGPDALAVLRRVFTPRAGHSLDVPGRMALGIAHRPGAAGDPIDEAMAVFWKGPKSFTAEDCAEIHTHGSPAVVAEVLDAVLAAGARLAEPGEFTKRAYLNGRIDLAQAEAVADLVQARTRQAERAAFAQLRGGLSSRVRGVRDALVPVIAELEAHVDFPEEGLEFRTRERLGAAIDRMGTELSQLLEGAGRGQLQRDGARVVLAGPPNAGKSSLFNLLCRRERALVTPHPGTTRDVVEASVDLRGAPIELADTAGLRAGAGEIESMGIERARERIAGADLVLFVIDRSQPLDEALAEWDALPDGPRLLVLNKADLPGLSAAEAASAFRLRSREVLLVSVESGDGFAGLEEAVFRRLAEGDAPSEETPLVANVRHRRAIEDAREGLLRAGEGLASELSPEFLVVDLAEAARTLDAITGERGALDERVLDAVFSAFCLGK